MLEVKLFDGKDAMGLAKGASEVVVVPVFGLGTS